MVKIIDFGTRKSGLESSTTTYYYMTLGKLLLYLYKILPPRVVVDDYNKWRNLSLKKWIKAYSFNNSVLLRGTVTKCPITIKGLGNQCRQRERWRQDLESVWMKNEILKWEMNRDI